MRHKPALTPTMRLIIIALTSATTQLGLAALAEGTDASIYTVGKVTQKMVKRSLITRQTIGGMSYFSLPETTTVLKGVR